MKAKGAWFLALIVFASLLIGCLLTTSVADLTGGAPVAARDAGASFVLGGTVEGLDGATVTVAANTQDVLTITADGTFAFESRLAQGSNYIVRVLRTSDGRACWVRNGEGHIDNADVTNVSVTCPSENADLADLRAPFGTLSPVFAPGSMSYALAQTTTDVFGLRALAVTLIARTASSTASVLINGETAKSGEPSVVGGLHDGVNMVSVVVRAANGTAEKTYAVAVTFTVKAQQAHIKASNARPEARLGGAVAISQDGSTLAVGSEGEPSAASGINGNQNDESAKKAGAVYVFVRSGTSWTQQAYIKASNARAGSFFGGSVAISGDGNTLAVGAELETSAATGIGGNQSDTSASNAGAVYVFTRSGSTWTQTTYIKAPNARAAAHFGASIAMSSDGSVLAIGSSRESSAAKGIDGNAADTSAPEAGAVYVVRRASASSWAHEAYVKASNTRATSAFGASVALSADGSTLAVGALLESSAAGGVNGNQADTSAPQTGAVYAFVRSGTSWAQQAYIKPSNPAVNSFFALSVALSSDGSTLAVGSVGEPGGIGGINGNQADRSAGASGAVYLLRRSGAIWTHDTYVKASTPLPTASFGAAVALSADGRRLAVGAVAEASGSNGVNGDETDRTQGGAGAAYAFTSTGGTWRQHAYVKASNSSAGANFGVRLCLSGDGTTLAVGSPAEATDSSGINTAPVDPGTLGNSGAAYVFR